MTADDQKQLGKTLWNIADQLRGSMNADDFRDYMLSFLFLRYLSDNYEQAAKRELGADYPEREPDEGSGDSKIPARSPLVRWYEENAVDVEEFEKQMRRKVHYVIEPDFLWGNALSGRSHDARGGAFRVVRRERLRKARASRAAARSLTSDSVQMTSGNDSVSTFRQRLNHGACISTPRVACASAMAARRALSCSTSRTGLASR